jgi:hypothetical protein
MTHPAEHVVATFLTQAQLQLDWLKHERAIVTARSENNEGNLQAIDNASQELSRLIRTVSTKASPH